MDPARPATWRKGRKMDATSEVFTFLDQVIRRSATLAGIHLTVAKEKHWVDMQFDEETFVQGEFVRDQATQLLNLIGVANVTLEIAALQFPDGIHLLDLTGDLKETATRHEVVQI